MKKKKCKKKFQDKGEIKKIFSMIDKYHEIGSKVEKREKIKRL